MNKKYKVKNTVQLDYDGPTLGNICFVTFNRGQIWELEDVIGCTCWLKRKCIKICMDKQRFSVLFKEVE